MKNMKEKGKLIGMIFLVLVIIGVIAITTLEGKQAKTEEGKTLTIGLDDNFPPYGYRNEKNEIVGFDIDLAKAVCEKKNWKLIIQPISWAAKEQEIDSGNIDCIWNGFGITPEREAKFTVTNSYVNDGNQFYCKNGSSYEKQEDFKGKKIGVQTGSTQQTDIENSKFGEEIGELIQYNDYLTALMDLETGGIDAVYMSQVSGNYVKKSQNKDFKVIEAKGISDPSPNVVALKKGNTELRDEINQALAELKEEGKLKELSIKWFDKDLT